MRVRVLPLLGILILLSLACQLASGGSTGSGSDAGDYAYIFEAPADPLRITVDPDETRAVEEVISLDGGSLTTSAADGTTFRLDIPADALLAETTIRMTPVEDIEGLPFGGAKRYAVGLEPQGLALFDFANLTITPAQTLPVDRQILFGYRGDGENLILAIPAVDSQDIQIRLLHFSGYGATDGSLADVAPVRGSLGKDAGSRLESAVGEAAQAVRQGRTAGDLAGALEEFFHREIGSLRSSAASSCAEGRAALVQLMSAMRQAQLIGAPIADEMQQELTQLIAIVAEQCMKEEYNRCTEDHVIHRILPFYLGWARQLQLGLAGDARLASLDQQFRQYVEQCLSFEVVFESTVVSGPPDDNFESRVKATVPMRFDVEAKRYVGQAPLVNESFVYTLADPECSPIAERGGGTFEAPQLAILAEYADPSDEIGRVRDLSLAYFPGQTSEAWGRACPDGSFGPIQSPIWTGMFIAAHGAECGTEGCFVATDWEIFGDEYFAKKEWHVDMPDLELVEIGTLKLYHKPGS